ncbi:MAG: glycosyltransferase, partial [Candidatus Wallbacteria bacterium]|nr:glycosyltransferase [Candidatus Wallbacteria bacterium]
LIFSLEIGGAEADLLQKMQSLAGRFEFMVVTLCRKGEWADSIPGVKVVNLGMRSKIDLRAVSRFLRVVRAFTPDILHCHLFNAGLFGRLSALFLRLKTVVTVQMIRPDRPLWQKIADFKLQFVTSRVIAASEAIRSQLISEGIFPSRISVQYNCIDLARFASHRVLEPEMRFERPDGCLLVGSLCRLNRDKGLDYLVQAAALLRDRKDLRFVVVGGGPEQEFLRALIREKGLENRFFLAGPTNRPEQVYPQFDIFVIPSRTEGLGIALIEAMACGLPSIGANVGGIPEIIENGKNGLLFPAGDVKALAECILRLVEHPEERSRFSSAARASVERFRSESLAPQLEKLYLEVIENR